jgi:hypothetical protein
MPQLMFELEVIEERDNLVCIRVNAPNIASVPVNEYGRRVLKHVAEFSSSFLALVREAAMS